MSASMSREMVNLYRSILQTPPVAEGGHVIEVISARPGEGVTTVVGILAEIAAGVGNARVLICNATAMQVAMSPTISLAKLSEGPTIMSDLSQVFEWVPSAGSQGSRWASGVGLLPENRSKFALTSVAKTGRENEVAIRVDRLDAVFAALRREFDLIVIDAGAASEGTLGLALARKADRVLLVLEADRTRVRVAANVRHEIEANGGQLLGVVFNKRRYRMPRFIYRWLHD
jgi:MinD-like ATPase involved in chromosome partitioning or flagellar assembly